MHGFAGAAFVLGAARWGSAPAAVLTGTQFDLTIDELPVNFTGARRTAVAINGQVPGPTLRFREGDTVTIRVTNRLRETTALHWHGLIVPADMDGVPGVSFEGIASIRATASAMPRSASTSSCSPTGPTWIRSTSIAR